QVQQSCNSSSASPDTSEEPCPTDMVKMTKSKTFQAYLPSCHRTYSCIHCRAHLANHDELISKHGLYTSYIYYIWIELAQHYQGSETWKLTACWCKQEEELGKQPCPQTDVGPYSAITEAHLG
ncbi:hypothetical protein JOQ06_011254, partial [Pogonophryne albipinna]